MKVSKLVLSGMAVGIVAAAGVMAETVRAADLGTFVVGSVVPLNYLCPTDGDNNTMTVTNDSAVVVFSEFAMDDDASGSNPYLLRTGNVGIALPIGSYVAVVDCSADATTFVFEFTLVAPPPTTTTTTTTTIASTSTLVGTTTTATAAAVLPATGSGSDSQIALVAGFALLSGVALLLVRRRSVV